MQIAFRLCWLKEGASAVKAFKRPEGYKLFMDYLGRIAPYAPIQITGGKIPRTPAPSSCRWLCTPQPPAQPATSEKTASKIQALLNQGIKQLEIIIGDADGFSASQIKTWAPDFLWSFGPLTFPHELAAIIAGEQIYRSFAILNHLPYHSGH